MNHFIKSHYITLCLILLDALAFCGIWFGLYHLRDALADYRVMSVPINAIDPYLVAPAVYLPFWFAVGWYEGLYNHRAKLTGINQASGVVKTFFVGLCGSLAIAYLFKQWDIGRFILLLTAPLITLWFYSSRTILRRWKQAKFRRGIGVTRVVIIGVGKTARHVVRRLHNHPQGGYQIAGFVDHHLRRKLSGTILDYPVLGSASNLENILTAYRVDEVFLAVPHLPQSELMHLIMQCEDLGVQIKIVTNIFDVITSQVQIDEIAEVPVVQLRNTHLQPFEAGVKRALDICVAAVLLLITGLPMLMVALLIRLDSPGPSLFRQDRVGKDGRRFRMWKFRTMRTNADPYAIAPTEPEDGRITRVGQWLRKFSIDEFPQLFNVLLGDMSMVGPRPEMQFLVDQYKEWERRRLDVKPGVTGLWQIVGRKNLPLSLNMEYDFYYIKNQSLLMDIVILIKTVPAVIFGKGAF